MCFWNIDAVSNHHRAPNPSVAPWAGDMKRRLKWLINRTVKDRSGAVTHGVVSFGSECLQKCQVSALFLSSGRTIEAVGEVVEKTIAKSMPSITPSEMPCQVMAAHSS